MVTQMKRITPEMYSNRCSERANKETEVQQIGTTWKLSRFLVVVTTMGLCSCDPGPMETQGPRQIFYSYDDQGRVTEVRYLIRDQEAWTTRYNYAPELVDASITNPEGAEFGRYLYIRDSNERVIRKSIVDSDENDIGSILITYSENSQIVKVGVVAPEALPYPWDPIVDK